MSSHKINYTPSEEETIFLNILLTMIFALILLALIILARSVWSSEESKYSDLSGQRSFCYDFGGKVIEPTRETYDKMLCFFDYENTAIEYGIRKVKNEEWKESIGYEYDYCFTCWDSYSCSSPHNDILREKEVHC